MKDRTEKKFKIFKNGKVRFFFFVCIYCLEKEVFVDVGIKKMVFVAVSLSVM